MESKDEEGKRVNREEYKLARKEAKLAVTAAKSAAFESLYAGLEERGGKKRLYRSLKTEAIHLVWRLLDQYKERKSDLHIVFIDLEKAYDKILGEVLWRCLEVGGIPVAYIK
ncbi:uncharacterized protein LOC124887189 [Capsicum annuum]|uniref:uncharacterized protein LOC124887189 n=1 Tax=Capsicum annuum TaxID=4072 RepID=UPI001FB11117|nr:uncharacterized protein LOC124887189 [Capsicum annuum]